MSHCSTKGVLEPLYENSLSLNTWNVYDNAIKVFEDFRLKYNQEHKWPVPVSDLINFIVYLSSQSYSPNTTKSCLAGIGFKMKMNNCQDSTDSSVIKTIVKWND